MTMRKLSPRHFAGIVFLVVAAGLIAFVAAGGKHKVLIATTTPVLTYDGRAEDIIKSVGPGDQASYAKGAELMAQGVFADNPYSKMWAPGFMAIEAALIKWWHGPLVQGMGYLTALAWAFSLATIVGVLETISRRMIVAVAALSFLCLDLVRGYFLTYGILLSESIGIALFLPACLFLCLGFSRHKPGMTIAGTMLLIAATMIRAQFLLVSQACLGLLALFIVCVHLIPALRRALPGRIPLREVLICIALYTGLIGSYAMWNEGAFVHNEYMFGEPWRTPTVPANFIEQGGGGVLCGIDPATCQRMQTMPAGTVTWQDNRKAVLHVLLHHPLQVFMRKTPYFLFFFFFDPSPSWGDVLQNGLLASMALAALFGCLILRRRPFFQTLLLLQIGTWAGSLVGPYTFLHFEERYLYIGKAMGFVAFFTVLAGLIDERRRRRSDALEKAQRNAEYPERDQRDANQAEGRERLAQE